MVPVWVSLPELSWHCYYLEVVTSLLSPIGKVLFLDLVNYKKTRGSIAKFKMQVDLTKLRHQHIWIGDDDDDDEHSEGRWQTILYEDVLEYWFVNTKDMLQDHMLLKKR